MAPDGYGDNMPSWALSLLHGGSGSQKRPDTLRPLAWHLYHDHGYRVREVAAMLGVAFMTAADWVRKED